MRALGIDLGNKTMGLALSDPTGFLATGLETLRFEQEKFEVPLDYLVRFVDNNKVDLIVLGLPKNMDGSIGFQGQVVQRFKELLEPRLAIPIHLWDERLTSKMAESVMFEADYSRKKKKVSVDKIAATIILQSYLDSRK
ncbi:MAG: Holliday junction resolvase RuvX [Candidatus Izemoplasmatales bacterium]|nr:Holliday junction resolvase RuvX [bacterium]MDZ4196297.1 Holliday junction resolvase RuvX [Candidatus Izemoplasmatales bacterium]